MKVRRFTLTVEVPQAAVGILHGRDLLRLIVDYISPLHIPNYISMNSRISENTKIGDVTEWEPPERRQGPFTTAVEWDEAKKAIRADFKNGDVVEGRRWYPGGTYQSIAPDVTNWTANNGIACSGDEGTLSEGVCDFGG